MPINAKQAKPVSSTASNSTEGSERVFNRSSADAGSAVGIEFIRPSRLAESKKTGVVLEGYFEGTVPNQLTGKEDFKFTKEDGGAAVINHSGHLAALMKALKVENGNYVRVSYLGKEDYKGKPSHRFQLDVAE